MFLRFLVVLNFLSFLLISGFVLISSIVFRSTSTSNMTVDSTGLEECEDYDPNLQGLVVFYQYFLDLLSGTTTPFCIHLALLWMLCANKPQNELQRHTTLLPWPPTAFKC
ncbi:transmembrane channel-like protein 7 isoform X2 [Oncorhynchus masou masou]